MRLIRPLLISLAALSSTNLMAMKPLVECQFTKPTDVASAKVVTAKMKAECIPKIARIHSCIARTRLLIDHANDLSNTFVKGDQTKPLMIDEAVKGSFDLNKVDLSILRNFQSLETDYQKSLDEIHALVTTYRNKTGSLAALQDYIAEMDRGYINNTDVLAKLSRRESALLFYMDKAIELLRKSADSNRPEVKWVLSDKCKDAELGAVLGPLQISMEDTLSKIDQIHSVAVKSKQARDMLARYSYMAVRESLLAKYRSQAIAELGALDGKLQTVLEVSRLMDQFEHWTGWVASDSNRTKTIVAYLQFEGSQRIHASDLMTAKDFKEKIMVASESHPEVALPYLPRLDSVISEFEDNLAKLRSKGWQGYLTRQNILADEMLKIARKYPESCVSKLKAYKDSSQSVQGIEDFRESERQFKATMQACEVKK